MGVIMKLEKVEHELFLQYYVGQNGSRKVVAILDKNCIRYMVYECGKLISRHEYINGNKEICFKNATKALNKVPIDNFTRPGGHEGRKETMVSIVEIKEQIKKIKNLTEEDRRVLSIVDSFWGCSEDYLKAKLAKNIVKYEGCEAWIIAMNYTYGNTTSPVPEDTRAERTKHD